MKKIKQALLLLLILFVSSGLFVISGDFGLASASGFSFSISGPASITAGEPCKITISVVDSHGNLLPYAENAIEIVTNDVSGLPIFYKFSKGNKGAATFEVKFSHSGVNVLKVFDLKNPDVYTIHKFFVNVGKVNSIFITPSTITVYPGESVKFSIFSEDSMGNIQRNPDLEYINVKTVQGSASGEYVGSGVFKFWGHGECQVVVKNGSVFNSANVFVTKSKKDFLFVNLTTTNNGFRENTGYKIKVKNGEKTIKSGESVKLYFPSEVLFPCPCHKKIVNTEITVNGQALPFNPKLNCNGYSHILTINMPVSVPAFGEFTINILKSAGIMNPMRDSNLFVGVYVPEYSYTFYSSYVKIGNLIDTPKMYAFPSFTSRNADFVFVFHTKRDFYLKKGSPLGLVFPYGSILPDLPLASNFSINGYSLWKGSVVTKWNKCTYTITTPFDIVGNQTIIIKVSHNTGIILPPYEGKYEGGIIYNFNILTVKSSPVYIRYKPLLNVSAFLPEGNSAIKYLYNFEPEVSFKVDSTYGYIKTTVLYSVDNGKFVDYISPFLIKTNGTHTIKYYAINTLGIETNIRSFTIEVDTVPPEIEFYKSEKLKNGYTKYVFKSNELLSRVYINGDYTICNADTKEFYIILPNKPKSFVIKASDLAGNTVIKRFSE